jgi:hypothetical protein
MYYSFGTNKKILLLQQLRNYELPKGDPELVSDTEDDHARRKGLVRKMPD